jgi:hypothetical protein
VISVRELWWVVVVDGNFGLYLRVKLIFFSMRYYSLYFEVDGNSGMLSESVSVEDFVCIQFVFVVLA